MGGGGGTVPAWSMHFLAGGVGHQLVVSTDHFSVGFPSTAVGVFKPQTGSSSRCWYYS